MNSNEQLYNMARYPQRNGQVGLDSKQSVQQFEVAQQPKDTDQNVRRQQEQDGRIYPFNLPDSNTNINKSSIPQRDSQQAGWSLSSQIKNQKSKGTLSQDKQLEFQSCQRQCQAQNKQNIISSVKQSIESKTKNKKQTQQKNLNNSKNQKQNKQTFSHPRTRDSCSQAKENRQLAGQQQDDVICFEPKHIYLNLDLISSASKRGSYNRDQGLQNSFAGPVQKQLLSANFNNLDIQVNQDSQERQNNSTSPKLSQEIAHNGKYFKTAKFNNTFKSGGSVSSKDKQDYARKRDNHDHEINKKETSFASDSKRRISERNNVYHEPHSQTILSNTTKTKFQSHSSSAYFKAIQAAYNSSPKMNLADGNFYNQENILSRNTFWIEHTKVHKKLLAEHYSDEEMKECSFSPKLFAHKIARKCNVATHNDFEQVNQSLNPEFHKLAADSKCSYTSLHAFKKQMGFIMPLKSAHS